MNFMNNVQKMSLTAALALAIIISCSEYPEKNFDELAKGLNYEYCMFKESSMCLKGLYAECPQGGSLRSKCPYPQTSEGTEYAHCVFKEDGVCFNGPYKSCPTGAELSNSCLTEYTYCIFAEDYMCLEGPYGACAGNGMLSNNCPYTQSASSNAPLYDYCVFEEEKICLEGPHTVCPTGGTQNNDCPYISSSSSEEPSSSSSENASSSSSGESNSSSSEDSSSSVEESSSSSELSSSSATPMCGTKEYDPETEECCGTLIYLKSLPGAQCYGTMVYAHCDIDGEPYNIESQFCSSEGVKSLCNKDTYEPLTHFCYNNNQVMSKCNGETFPYPYICMSNAIRGTCNGLPYNPTTDFCHTVKGITPLCGGDKEYTAEQFCKENGEVHALCGIQEYNTEDEGCCNATRFTKAIAFCQSGTNIIPLCGGKEYLDTETCYKDGNAITGSFIDSRDGKEYKYTKIGDQKWMAENLRYSGEPDTLLGRCYSSTDYPDETTNCAKYGRLYDWATVMGITSNSTNFPSPPKYPGICPAGWHVPQISEFEELLATVGSNTGTELKAQFPDWNGTDDYGFSALPGGYYDGKYRNILSTAHFHSATENGYAYARYLTLSSSSNASTTTTINNEKSRLKSLRCVED